MRVSGPDAHSGAAAMATSSEHAGSPARGGRNYRESSAATEATSIDEEAAVIDLASEHLIRISEVPRHLPVRPNGKRLHISACYRWILKGTRGVVLESIRIGGTTYTSIEAVQRFGDRLTESDFAGAAADVRTPRRRERQRERAHIELLNELGIEDGGAHRGLRNGKHDN